MKKLNKKNILATGTLVTTLLLASAFPVFAQPVQLTDKQYKTREKVGVRNQNDNDFERELNETYDASFSTKHTYGTDRYTRYTMQQDIVAYTGKTLQTLLAEQGFSNDQIQYLVDEEVKSINHAKNRQISAKKLEE
jgi:hypothetical protein